MKKHLFFLFAALTLLTAPGAMRAQTTVTIGNESSTNSAYIMPVNMYYNYSLTQQIYRANEINMPDGGTITSISFEYLYSEAFSLSGIKVFMKNTTKESFTNNNDWVEVSASDKVFEGTFSASGAGWVTLTLNTPFHYDGTSNLLVCFYDPTNGYPGSSYKFRTTSTTSDYPGQYLALTCNSDSYVPDPDDLYSYSGAKGLQTIRNNIRLTINPDITEVYVNDFTLPAWGEHPDYSWSIPSGVNYYIDNSSSQWKDATTSGNIFSGNVFNQEGHNYVLTLKFNSIYGWHISSNATVYLNGVTNLIASTTLDAGGHFIAQTIPFLMVPGHVVTIGEGTSSSAETPYASMWNYSVTEQIYTANEIGVPNGGTISSIRFQRQSDFLETNHITVYMKNVSRSSFADLSDPETLLPTDIVYEGDYTFTQGWSNIDLDLPFQYDGSRNLMVAIHEDTPGHGSSDLFYYSDVPNSVFRLLSDSGDPDPYNIASSSASKYIGQRRANIQIVFAEPSVTANDGGATNDYVPVYGYYTDAYLKAEFVTPASSLSEIPNNGLITGMTFYASNPPADSWGSASFKVFLKEVNSTTLSSFTGYDDATVVYEGALHVVGDKMKINFTTPYEYHGGNLLVGVYNMVEGTFKSCSWQGVAATGASIQGYSYNSLDGITATQRNFLPKTTFSYQRAPVQIGDGTATNTYLPSYSYYRYGLSEQIYTVDEIGSAGTIQSVSFYNAGNTETRSYDVYLALTSKQNFESISDWEHVTASDLVFSGDVVMTSGEWTTIELSTPFAYDGISNLLLVMDDNTGSYTSSPHMACRVFDAPGQALYDYNDNTNFDPSTITTTGTMPNVKNQIKLDIEPFVCTTPSDLAASDITATSATVSWSMLNSYEWTVRYSTDPTFATYETEWAISSTWPLTNLTPETTYYVQVEGYCFAIGSSMWSDVVSFTTPAGYSDGDIIDFEPGNFSQYPFDNDVSYPWIIVDASNGCDNGSVYCMKSGNAGESSSTSTIEATHDFTSDGYITFDAKCMGEGQDYDICEFYIDGELQFSHDEDISGWQPYVFLVSPGTHTFTWSYSKDFSVDPDGDGFFVDNIVFGVGTPCVPPTVLTVASTTSSAEVSWNGVSESFNVRFRRTGYSTWANTQTIPTNSFTFTSIAPGDYDIQVAASCDPGNWISTTFSVMEVFSTANWYGYVSLPLNGEDWGDKFISFSMQDPATVAAATTNTTPYTCAATYANGYVWKIDYNTGDLTRAALDNTNKTISAFETISTGFETYYVPSLSYNPVDGRMYYINDPKELRSFDPADPVGTLTTIGVMDYLYTPLAINRYGQAFGFRYQSNELYQIDLSDASTTLIGTTNTYVENPQAMAFDMQTDELFFAHHYGISDVGLYKVDPSTAHVCFIGQIGGGNGAILTALFSGDNYEVACPAPSALTVSNVGSVGAGVSWEQSGDSDHWIVQCSANSDFSTASEVSVGSPYWYIYSLNPNTTYYVRVANDCGSDGISSWSNTVTFTTTESPCLAPTNLTVSNVSYNGADLTWDQPGDGYEWLIEYSINPEFSSSSFESSFDPYLSLTGLDPITTYYVRVANDCGTMGNSDWVTTSFTTTGGIIVIPDIIDFEPGDFSQYPFDNSSTYPWIIADASNGCDNGSTYCMRSGNAGIASSSSTIEATYDYPDAGYITFDAKCMGEGTNWDVCKFFIDGVLQFSYGEYMAGWNHYSYIVPAGTHTFTWSYTKDSSEDPDGDGFFVDNIEFGIGMPCLTPPIDLTAYNITDNSVDVSWTGSGEAYTVKYRPVLLFDDFENGLSQWTQIDADGDGNGWLLGSDLSDDYFTHSGTDLVLSKSYDNTAGVALTPDNYLVSPQFSLGGIVEFWAKPRDSSWLSEHFSIAVSTTGNTDPADFQTVPGAEWTFSAGDWQKFVVDLSAYAGEQGYVALRHHDCTDQYYLDVDDFIIYAPGEWQTIATTSENTVITGLDPETSYMFQVQSDCGSDGTSEWSELMSFTTTNVTCLAPTNLIVTNVTENTASLSWTGPSDGIEWDLWYSTTSDFATFGHEIVDATTWTLEGLTAGTTYYARVRTFCGTMGNSEWSNTVTFTTTSNSEPEPLVEIGSGESTNVYLPSYSFYRYSLSQQIYTAAEIGQVGTVYSVSFYNDGATKTRTYDMYLVHTNKTNFSGSSDWVPVTATDRVFSGEMVMTAGEWTTFELTAPFTYNGIDNLLLVMDDNTGSWTSSPQMACKVFDATEQAIRIYNDDTNYNPYNPSEYSGTVLDVKNQIQLGFVPIYCHKPTALTVFNLGISSATISWTEMGTATAWQICLNDDEAHLINVTSTNYTFTSLTPGTTYSVKVRANCGSSDGVSEWKEATFTTYPCEVSDLSAMATIDGKANISWYSHSSSFDLRYRIEGGSWTTVTGITDYSYTITGLPVGDYEVEVAPDCDPTNFTSTTFSIMEVLSTANWYGHPVYTPDGQDWLYKYVSFSVQNPAVVTPATEVLTTNSNGYTYAAALVDGYVWCITVEGNLARAVLDNDSKTISAFETVVPGFESTYSSSMSYNPVDGRLYYIMYNDHKLKSFSPSDVSDVVEVGEYSIDALTLAINSAGEAYCIEISTGDLYQINLSDASTTLVGNTGLSVGYAQDMAFDLTTGELFWTRESSSGRGLYLVSTSTATAMFIGTIGGGQGAEVTGLFMGESTTFSCPFPTNLTVYSAIETNAVMSWTENGSATSWDYQIDTDLNFPNGELNQYSVTDNPYTLSSLTTGTTYYVRVRANCGGGEHSAWSSPVSFTVYPCELTDVTVTSSPNGTATVNWSGHSDTYSVSYRLVGSSEWTTIPSIPDQTYTLTGLPAGDYELSVTADCGDPSSFMTTTFSVMEVLSSANWYGYGAYTDESWVGKYISFSMQNPGTVVEASATFPNMYAAAYADGYVWFIDANNDLCRSALDNSSKTISDYETIVPEFVTEDFALAMSYNPADGKFYYIRGTGNSSRTLVSFDPANPTTVTEIGTFTNATQGLAINNAGEAYSVENTTGDLYRVNLTDASVTLVGNTGHPLFYVQDMAFDLQTGELFWAHYYNSSDNALYMVNPATAATMLIGHIGNGTEVDLTGLFMVADETPTCPAPTDLAVETTHPGDATFSWTSGNDYNLRLREVGGEWMYFDQVSSPYPVTTLDANTDYEAQAQLDCGSDGLSDWGNLVSFTTLPCPAPTNLTVSDITLTSAELSWSQSGGGYEWNVEYSTSSDFSSSTTEWVLSSSYSMANLAPGTTYYVRVQSICPISIPGGVSDVVTFTTEECPAPTNVTVSNITSTTAEINWTQSGAGFEWDIEYSTSSDFSTYHTVWAIGYPWTLDNLVPETTYYVRVKSACYDHIEGGTSAAVTFTTSSVSCPAPTNLTVTNVTKHSATVDWTETGTATTWFVVLNNDLDNAIELIGHPYTLLGLTPETEYTVAVYASCDLDVTSPLSTPVTFTTEGCTAPNDLTLVSAGAVSASLSWASGDTYRLRYRTAGGEWIDATAEGVTSPFSLSGLQTGTAYEVQAQRDCGADGLSPWGNIVSFTTETCGVPTDLELLSVSANSITITWASGLPYNVRYRRTTGESDLWHQVTNKIPPYTINGLLPGNTYRVQVQDICATGGGTPTFSTALVVTTLSCTTPDDVTITDITSNSANVIWTSGDTYNLRYRENGGAWTNVTGVTSPYALTGLHPNSFYELQAQKDCGADGLSSWSDVVTFTTAPSIVPTIANITGNSSVCPGNTTELTATSDVEVSYLWSTGETTQTITVGPGDYSVIVTSTTGDELASGIFTVSLKESYTTEDNQSVCQNELPYVWNGESYSTPGNYTKTLTAANGCDSVVTLHLTVNSTYAVTDTRAVCPSELPYTWNGFTFHSAGTQPVTLQTVNGCDSVVTMTLTLNQTYNTPVTATICQGDSYSFFGQTLTTSDTYTHTLQTVNGCDSVITLTLTVNPTYAVTDQRTVCPGELPLTWNGKTFTEAGTKTATLQTVNGCDSTVTMTLHVFPTYNVPVTATVCQGESYSFFGQTLTSGGTYTHTLQTVNGCDSIVTLTLTVNPTYAVTDTRTVCPSELPLTWNGKTFTEAGTQTATLQTANGCDSTVTMTLHVNPAYNVPVTAAICQGDSYSFFGQPLTTGGIYTHTLQTVNGCDSVITLTLTVNPTYLITEERTVCSAGLPYLWNGVVFTGPGTKFATLHTATGCDSVVTMILTVDEAFEVTVNRAVCVDELPVVWNGKTFNAAGTQTVTLEASNGCDSIVTMVVTVNTPVHQAYTVVECGSYTWTNGDGATYTASGTHTYSHTDANGCTQVDTLHLTIHNPVHTAVTVSECGSFTWNGQTYTTSGNYTYSHTDANGCTQVDTLHLTIYNPVNTAITAQACGSFVWNGETYTTSGTHTFSHTDAHGCTQVDTLHLTIYNPVNTAITAQACGSFVWNGETYTTSGTHTFSHTDAHGCTQVDTLHLTIFNPVHQTVTVSECGSYTWNGQTYTASGNYTHSHLDANGCTQVDTLHLTIFNPVHTAVTVSECGSYTWNGQTYTASGNYTYSHLDANGCTQVDTLHLTILNPVHQAITVNECGSYTWNGQTYTASGNYTHSHLDANGCTQVDTLHLTIFNPMHTAVTVSACGSYTWADGNGQTYITSGDFTYSHLDAHGCTQVDTLHLTILHGSSAVIANTICASELPYEWNGVTFTEAGMQTTTIEAANGCDSVVTMVLMVNTPVHHAYTAEACGSYTWNGTVYSVSGNYTYSHQDVNGCTQVDTLHLTIFQPANIAITVAECGSYTWTSGNGVTYTASGNYTYSHTDANGCTQVDTLHLTIFNPVHQAVTVSECGSYTWNGTVYETSGTYTYSHLDNNGCTQVDTLHLTIHSPVHQAVTVSECGSYTWNGTVYETSGTYTYSHLDNNGCTQVDTLHLTIHNPVHQAVTVTECGDYTWNGQTYTESGDYTYSHLDNNGCTQVDTLHLTINHPAGTAVTVTECASYTWTDGNGQTYTESGIYTYSHLDVVGCTQVDTLYLTINEPEATTLTATVCPAALPYTWNGVVFTAAGTQSVTLTAANGCDSVVNMILTVGDAYTTNETVAVCASELPYTWNGVVFTAAGTQSVTLTAANGCDSVVNMTLTLLSPVTETVEASACGSYFWNNANYTESGDYTATFTTANGCDSIVTLHLTINQSVQTELYETACDSYTWTDGNTYTQSDDYAMTLTAANGCDSIVVLHLTIHNSATSEFSIEWMDDTPYTWNGQEYTESGDYTQTLQTVDGCDSVVTLHLTITVDVDVYDAAAVYIAPNPAKEVCRIVGLESAPISVDLFDMRGKLLMRARSTEFDVSTLPSGMYMVKVNTGDRIINLKLIRQ